MLICHSVKYCLFSDASKKHAFRAAVVQRIFKPHHDKTWLNKHRH